MRVPTLRNQPPGLERDGYVFISYKREDAGRAALLHSFLRAAKFNVWWDVDIQCGQVWSEALDKAALEAGCIIVLWSSLSIQSQWVSHEASLAMARGVYVPARIDLCAISPPYDRLQASDILDWNGDESHPGVIALLRRCTELLPLRKRLPQRVAQWVFARRAAVLSTAFAVVALGVLTWQTMASRTLVLELAEQAAMTRPFHMLWVVFYFDEAVLPEVLNRAIDLTFIVETRQHNRPQMRIQAAAAPAGAMVWVAGQLIPTAEQCCGVVHPRPQAVFGHKTTSYWIRVPRHMLQGGRGAGPYSTMGDFRDVTFWISVEGTHAGQLRAVVASFNGEGVAVPIPLSRQSSLQTTAFSSADIYSQWRAMASLKPGAAEHLVPPSK